MAESEEELKILLIKVKEKSEKMDAIVFSLKQGFCFFLILQPKRIYNKQFLPQWSRT